MHKMHSKKILYVWLGFLTYAKCILEILIFKAEVRIQILDSDSHFN
jgi:hypothetical protein